jgi:lantibiotic modifying enzyme
MFDLYGGLPGVTLFLAYLGAITGEQRYTVLAQRAGETMLRRLEKSKSSVKSIGAFSGWGGVIYTLSHLGALWREAELLSKAEALVATLPGLIELDEYLDIIGGAAGCIGGLLSLYDQVQSERTLHAAVQCGERLVARAQQVEHGVGWLVPREPRPLAGFAHGAAGIAWALLKLAAVTGVNTSERPLSQASPMSAVSSRAKPRIGATFARGLETAHLQMKPATPL